MRILLWALLIAVSSSKDVNRHALLQVETYVRSNSDDSGTRWLLRVEELEWNGSNSAIVEERFLETEWTKENHQWTGKATESFLFPLLHANDSTQTTRTLLLAIWRKDSGSAPQFVAQQLAHLPLTTTASRQAHSIVTFSLANPSDDGQNAWLLSAAWRFAKWTVVFSGFGALLIVTIAWREHQQEKSTDQDRVDPSSRNLPSCINVRAPHESDGEDTITTTEELTRPPTMERRLIQSVDGHGISFVEAMEQMQREHESLRIRTRILEEERLRQSQTEVTSRRQELLSPNKTPVASNRSAVYSPTRDRPFFPPLPNELGCSPLHDASPMTAPTRHRLPTLSGAIEDSYCFAKHSEISQPSFHPEAHANRNSSVALNSSHHLTVEKNENACAPIRDRGPVDREGEVQSIVGSPDSKALQSDVAMNANCSGESHTTSDTMVSVAQHEEQECRGTADFKATSDTASDAESVAVSQTFPSRESSCSATGQEVNAVRTRDAMCPRQSTIAAALSPETRNEKKSLDTSTTTEKTTTPAEDAKVCSNVPPVTRERDSHEPCTHQNIDTSSSTDVASTESLKHQEHAKKDTLGATAERLPQDLPETKPIESCLSPMAKPGTGLFRSGQEGSDAVTPTATTRKTKQLPVVSQEKQSTVLDSPYASSLSPDSDYSSTDDKDAFPVSPSTSPVPYEVKMTNTHSRARNKVQELSSAPINSAAAKERSAAIRTAIGGEILPDFTPSVSLQSASKKWSDSVWEFSGNGSKVKPFEFVNVDKPSRSSHKRKREQLSHDLTSSKKHKEPLSYSMASTTWKLQRPPRKQSGVSKKHKKEVDCVNETTTANPIDDSKEDILESWSGLSKETGMKRNSFGGSFGGQNNGRKQSGAIHRSKSLSVSPGTEANGETVDEFAFSVSHSFGNLDRLEKCAKDPFQFSESSPTRGSIVAS